MAKFRIYGRSISDVYIDIEANTIDEAHEVAKESDGGDWHEDGFGSWEIDYEDTVELSDDAEVDYTYAEFFGGE